MNKYKILLMIFVGVLFAQSAIAQNEADSLSSTKPVPETEVKVDLGYGVSINEKEMTSAVSTVHSQQLSKYSVANPGNALFGQLSGLTVLQNGGDIWSQNPTLFVRGVATMGNKSPLVLVDGYERNLASLSLVEIESVSVLKDAAATAIYGVKGANGVILVTTKRGSQEKLKISASYEYGMNQPFRMPQMLDAHGYANAYNEALILDGKSPRYSVSQLDAYKNGTYPDYYPNVDWLDEIMNDNGQSHELNLSFTGGSKVARYYTTINYVNQTSLMNGKSNIYGASTEAKFEKLNIRTNLDIDVTKSTLLKVNLAGRLLGYNRPGVNTENIFSLAYRLPSNAYPVKYEDGRWGGSTLYGDNPMAQINGIGFGKSLDRSVFADMTLKQDLSALVEGLSFSVSGGIDNYVTYWDNQSKDYAYDVRTADIDEINGNLYNKLSQSFGDETELSAGNSVGNQGRMINVVGQINYEKQWGDHKLSSGLYFHQDEIVGNSQYSTYRTQTMALQGHYVNNNKYFADLTVSYSGTSILPKENRFAIYPALSLGWMISEESFLKESQVVNMLKLRASSGLVGLEPSQINLHEQQYYSGQGYNFNKDNGGYGGIYEGALPNSDFRAEKAFISNVGIDARLLKGLDLSVDGFFQERSNILVSEAGSVSQTVGVGLANVNEGVVRNMGVDLSANWNQTLGDFKYFLGGNFSFSRNEIIEQNETYRPYDYLKRTGQSVGQTFGLVSDGIFDQAAIDSNTDQYFYSDNLKPGDVKYKDLNNDGFIDDFDMTAIGYNQINPEMYYGFTLGAEYKGFGFSGQFQGASNINIYLNTPGVYRPLVNNVSISTFANDRWTPSTAATATLPRLTVDQNLNNYRVNDIWVQDGSYLKLRNLEVYYNLPKKLLSSLNMQGATFYVRGMNLLSFDDVEMMDPEEIRMVYPTLKSFHIGMKVNF
ncbi:SusC/RagA family TonB-linked outer membrane protein [Labilibacter sediminis]|nr:SusC/RagA family TonB-linked outer membrane protein [Labilibacter sediminis]